MITKGLLGNVLMVLATTTAVVMTVVVVRDDLAAGQHGASPAKAESQAPVKFKHWSEVIGAGQRIGSDSAPVTIVEFGDFECPACGGFSEMTLTPLMREYPTAIALVFHHLPLSYHRFAYPAARAAECAASQGRFAEIQSLLYEKQDSLGLKTFHDFARASGVADLNAFDKCNTMPGKVETIERDIRLAKSLGLTATPTVMVNGMRWLSTPDSSALNTQIQAILKTPGRRL